MSINNFVCSTDKHTRLPDTSATRHFGIKTLWDTSASVSRHFDTQNVVQDTSTRVPWSRKSRDTSTQDNSYETQLHRWFVLNFSTNFVVPKCPRVSWCRIVLWPNCPAPTYCTRANLAIVRLLGNHLSKVTPAHLGTTLFVKSAKSCEMAE